MRNLALMYGLVLTGCGAAGDKADGMAAEPALAGEWALSCTGWDASHGDGVFLTVTGVNQSLSAGVLHNGSVCGAFDITAHTEAWDGVSGRLVGNIDYGFTFENGRFTETTIDYRVVNANDSTRWADNHAERPAD